LARSSGSKIYLLQVVAAIPGYELQPLDLMAPTVQVNLEMMGMMEAAARERLESLKAEAARQGLELEIRVRSSATAYEGILEEAEQIQPRLIIMGRHGRTGLSRLLIGSVTARVIGHSPFNVLVVPTAVSLDCKEILMGNDGSIYSLAAWEVALRITAQTGAGLIAVSVAREEEHVKRAREIVEKMRTQAELKGVALKPLVLRGRPFEAILKAAQENGVNLIVLGSHGRTGLSRLLMGSVTERVIGQAACPVLVVKRGQT
jgi:nucleotide-binding universal stress UspA family protein